MLPLQNWGWTSNSTDFRVRGRPGTQEPPPFPVELRYVTPGYFQALGVPILSGRGFTDGDTREALPVILRLFVKHRPVPGIEHQQNVQMIF